jgi:hypothetical protein
MKLLKQALFLLAITTLVFTSCEKDDDDNNNNNNNGPQDRCEIITCFNNGTCAEGVCACPADWTGTFCDTSAILTPYFKPFKVTTAGSCSFNPLDIQFVAREKEPNPLVCDLIVSIGCNFGRDKVVRFYTVFDGNNFTTNTVNCVYNNLVESSYAASGYFTTDSIYITVNSSYRIAPPQSCTYAAAR